MGLAGGRVGQDAHPAVVRVGRALRVTRVDQPACQSRDATRRQSQPVTQLARRQPARHRQVLEGRQLHLVDAGLPCSRGALVLPRELDSVEQLAQVGLRVWLWTHWLTGSTMPRCGQRSASPRTCGGCEGRRGFRRRDSPTARGSTRPRSRGSSGRCASLGWGRSSALRAASTCVLRAWSRASAESCGRGPEPSGSGHEWYTRFELLALGFLATTASADEITLSLPPGLAVPLADALQHLRRTSSGEHAAAFDELARQAATGELRASRDTLRELLAVAIDEAGEQVSHASSRLLRGDDSAEA